ncbi:outer membrane protein [Pannonibacter tanglangensis]|uniref:outer membrane protein n=1 Tax=Pannonibacter tanglangensis TaxID=2750084 RepID=UPI001AD8C5C9|nr:outer membrane beta-barrel protein [Pannonibacter sp. XCT-53]
MFSHFRTRPLRSSLAGLFPLVLGLGLSSGSAGAADMPQPLPDYDQSTVLETPRKKSPFEGAYFGVEAGASSSATRTEFGSTKKTMSRVDAAFGAFAGYNWQVSRVVLGVEGSATYLGSQYKGQVAGLGQVKASSPWSLGLRGRIGLPIDNFMPYLSLGLAATEHSYQVQGFKAKKGINIGTTVGAGLEVALTDNLRARADYTLSAIAADKHTFGGRKVKDYSANHRLMLGVAYAF